MENNAIIPKHYNEGEIDLIESWYLRYPFKEFKTGMVMYADRYFNRDKEFRIQDMSKGIYVMERLKEYEIREEAREKETPLDMNQLTELIKEWGGQFTNLTIDKQTLKVGEEVGELFQHVVKGQYDKVIDDIGDIYVTIVLLTNLLDLTIEECVAYAYDEIKDRTGKVVDGTFIKDSDRVEEEK